MRIYPAIEIDPAFLLCLPCADLGPEELMFSMLVPRVCYEIVLKSEPKWV